MGQCRRRPPRASSATAAVNESAGAPPQSARGCTWVLVGSHDCPPSREEIRPHRSSRSSTLEPLARQTLRLPRLGQRHLRTRWLGGARRRRTRRMPPVRSSDSTGATTAGPGNRGGRVDGVGQRKAMRRAGPGRRRRYVAETQLVLGAAAGRLTGIERGLGLLGADDPHTLGRSPLALPLVPFVTLVHELPPLRRQRSLPVTPSDEGRCLITSVARHLASQPNPRRQPDPITPRAAPAPCAAPDRSISATCSWVTLSRSFSARSSSSEEMSPSFSRRRDPCGRPGAGCGRRPARPRPCGGQP